MVRASLKSVAALLFAACLAAGVLAVFQVLPAYAQDVQVTAKVNNPMGKVDVAEGQTGANAGGENAASLKTIMLSGVSDATPGEVHFAVEATGSYMCIEWIKVSSGGEEVLIASCKPNDLDAAFYEPEVASKLNNTLDIDIDGMASESSPSTAPGESYKHAAQFYLTGITSDVTIEAHCDFTEQQTLTFYLNYDESDWKYDHRHFLHYGEPLGDPAPDPEREGYVFLGWATSRDGQPVEWDSQKLMGLENLSYYAVWQKDDEPTSPGEGEEVEPTPPTGGEEETDSGNDTSDKGDVNKGAADSGDGSGQDAAGSGDRAAKSAAGSDGEATVLAKAGDGTTAIVAAAAASLLVSAALAGCALSRKSARTRR